MRVLNQKQETLLVQERRMMSDLRTAMAQFVAEPEDQQALSDSIYQLDELFLLVVVGEFNSGKSAVINALLGQKLLEEGVTPTTTQIELLRFGEGTNRTVLDKDHVVLTYPVDFLHGMTIVDTPGTNAVIQKHETITSRFVPRSDLVLFITSADRPFTESERVFLKCIRQWGKKVIFILNKIDILQSPQETLEVEKFVRENGRLLLGIQPQVFPISARAALRAKLGEKELWEESRFELLEEFLHHTLDEGSRLRLKFSNPLGVALHLIDKYLGSAGWQMESLQTDINVLSDVERQLALYKEDMEHHFRLRMSDLEMIFFDMEERGRAFFDETFRLGRVFDLLSKARIQQEFQRSVVADVPREIEEKVTELIDWLVASELRQWQAITEHLSVRRQEHKDRTVGDLQAGAFRYDRQRLIDALGREARRVVETYDQNREAKQVAESAQTAVAASAAMEVGAVGLGAMVTALATTAALDITGVIMASLLATLGLLVIPARRHRKKVNMLEKIAAIRSQLIQSLQTRFRREVDQSVARVQEAIAPYTRFIRAEREKIITMQATLRGLRDEMDRLEGDLKTL